MIRHETCMEIVSNGLMENIRGSVDGSSKRLYAGCLFNLFTYFLENIYSGPGYWPVFIFEQLKPGRPAQQDIPAPAAFYF